MPFDEFGSIKQNLLCIKFLSSPMIRKLVPKIPKFLKFDLKLRKLMNLFTSFS